MMKISFFSIFAHIFLKKKKTNAKRKERAFGFFLNVEANTSLNFLTALNFVENLFKNHNNKNRKNEMR